VLATRAREAAPAGLAEGLGAESGSVTDLHLPKWLAHNLLAIHVPLVLVAMYLHTRNIHRLRASAPSVLPGQDTGTYHPWLHTS
jgi:hypothetical protein